MKTGRAFAPTECANFETAARPRIVQVMTTSAPLPAVMPTANASRKMLDAVALARAEPVNATAREVVSSAVPSALREPAPMMGMIARFEPALLTGAASKERLVTASFATTDAVSARPEPAKR